MTAAWMLVNAKNGISSYELGRALGVSHGCAWFMGHRIRLALQDHPTIKLGGHVEVDETSIGGNARYMHKDRRARTIKGTG